MSKTFEPDVRPFTTQVRQEAWQPWQMGQLDPASSARPSAETPELQESARQQELDQQSELDTLREQIRQQAHEQGYREGLEAGRQQGYDQGLEQGRAAGAEQGLEQTRQALAPLLPLAQNFSMALTNLDDDIAEALVELALNTGRQLAADALKARPEQVLVLVRELLQVEPTLSGSPRLWLHPADLELVQAQLGAELATAGWQLQPDEQLGRGGCRVTSASGELDASWESRWQAITGQLRHRHAQVEQAGTESAQ
ncbi:flagellar assembly protein FliH [Oceanisphaera arctica]|uniref:Flagellar assembly protein FliH n=1 Tax=Oceanisphaera arctica TaxID=641510 RepID=A0A2P5TMT8_9GAMM|nr:flagellar assembly protein FliH [Oceanisphaera arctica]PPL16747.1 flagellar assembly protein FliH [Oceanisphaera arctica]GHA06125.1 flagellar assembly protein FliH [Oceanisphaera arctica]